MLEPVRIALVLSAGGLRGAAHVGVLHELTSRGIRIDAIVGVSAGAVIGAYYAAVGLGIDELLDDAERFRGRHLLTYSINVQLGYRFERRIARWCGVIPHRLRQLESANFHSLHHGVQRLGIVCHDLASGQPHYFSSTTDHGVALSDAVRASASIPHLFPAVKVSSGGEALRLTDGGLSDAVPIAFARSPQIGATHVVVSDCRWIGRVEPTDAHTVWIRPRLAGIGTLWSSTRGLAAAVEDGAAAVTPAILDRVAEWFRCRQPAGDTADAIRYAQG